jgi:hypothetical protein
MFMACRVAVLAAAFLTVLPAQVVAQDSCPDYGDAGTHTSAISMRRTNGSCGVPNDGGAVQNGGYVKFADSYRVGVRVEVTGHCQASVWNPIPFPGACFDGELRVRNVGGTSLFDSYQPFPHFGNVQPSNAFTIQYVNTTGPVGTLSTGAPWAFVTVEGSHVITSVTSWNITGCNFTPLNFVQDAPFKAHVVRCLPQWQKQADGDQIKLSKTAISVYIDPRLNARMRGAVEDAVEIWDDILGPLPTLTVTGTPCVTPTATCITARTADPGDVNYPAECAITDFGQAADGGILSPVMKFLPESATWSVEADRHWALHELTHLLGLDESSSSCPNSQSLMKPVACNASGTLQAPTISDRLPVLNSSYGNDPTVACPVQ